MVGVPEEGRKDKGSGKKGQWEEEGAAGGRSRHVGGQDERRVLGRQEGQWE